VNASNFHNPKVVRTVSPTAANAALQVEVGSLSRPVDPRTKGGKRWKDISIVDLRAWIGILIYMGIKNKPYRRNYWSKYELLECQVIPRMMSCRRWEDITQYIYLVDNRKVVRDSRQVGYDKLAKVKWLVELFSKKSRELYNPGEFLTVDECVIPYKVIYCEVRQFFRNKPTKFGIKMWCVASNTSQYITDVQVYEGAGSHTAKEGMACEVVTTLLQGPEGHWHTLVCDNLFSSLQLFHDLLNKGIWAIGTLQPNRVGIPRSMVLHKGKNWKGGSLVIKMHRHRQMCVMNWQDSRLVRLLSTKQDPWRPNCNVLRRERSRRFHMGVLSTVSAFCPPLYKDEPKKAHNGF
jgi:hypothetical protein